MKTFLSFGALLLILTGCSSKSAEPAATIVTDTLPAPAPVTSLLPSVKAIQKLFEFRVRNLTDTAAIRKAFLVKYLNSHKYDTIGWNALQRVSVLASDDENPGGFTCVTGFFMSIDGVPLANSTAVPSFLDWSHYFFTDSAGVFKVYDNSIYSNNNDDFEDKPTRLILDYTFSQGCPLLGIRSEYLYGDGGSRLYWHKQLAFYVWSQHNLSFRKVTEDFTIEHGDGGDAAGKVTFTDHGSEMPRLIYTLSGDPKNVLLNGSDSLVREYRWEKDQYILVKK